MGTAIDPCALAAFLDDLYTAAAEGSGWDSVGERLAVLLGGRTSAMILTLADHPPALLGTSGIPEHGGRQYNDYFHRIDPWVTLAQVQPKFRAIVGSEVMGEREFRHTEYCTDFASRFGLHHLLGALVPLGAHPANALALTVHRPADGDPFEVEDGYQLNQLLPHLQRAGQLYLRVRQLEQRAHTGFAALEALPYGVIVASRSGEICFANAIANRLARDGQGLILGKRGVGLQASDPEESQTLRQRVREAADGGSGGALRITRRINDTTLAVLVLPLPPPYRELSGEIGLALVIVKNLADDKPPAASWPKMLWGLTEAEAQVALALFAGDDVEEIAQQRQVSVATVRTQIRQILMKTGASNLRGLIRQLAQLAGLAK
jgi:DNA-binding NarL/FixJ family response regulator